jgi:site-specific DNA-methyltransferase (adenine-specific)
MTRPPDPVREMPRPYYSHAGITIYHADCRDILPLMEPKSVDLVLTDPPYEAEAHTLGRRCGTTNGAEARPLDFLPMDAATRTDAGGWMAFLSRGWVLVFCQVEAAMLWREALAPARYSRTQIWRKPNGAPQFTGDRPGMGYESIVTCWAGEGKSRWNGGGRHGVYTHNVHDATDHLTEKPLPLIDELVGLFSDEGDLILDPFMGSGTTLVAAKQLGRRAIGIEIEEKYAEIAAKRLAQEVFDWQAESRGSADLPIQRDLLP